VPGNTGERLGAGNREGVDLDGLDKIPEHKLSLLVSNEELVLVVWIGGKGHHWLHLPEKGCEGGGVKCELRSRRVREGVYLTVSWQLML